MATEAEWAEEVIALVGPSPHTRGLLMTGMPFTRLDELPLFASDLDLGRALLGGARAREWKDIVAHYERKPGFPKIDPNMGGRYVPAVRRFFDLEYGLDKSGKLEAPDGEENWSAWHAKPRRRKLTP